MTNKDKDVETKVVQMEFDNRQFNKDVDNTRNKVDKLDESVRMKGADKDVNKITKSFSALKVMATTALATIAVKITNSVAGIVKQVSGIQNAINGWSRYEESLTTVGGIINNISNDFETVEEATEAATAAMEKLQWYTDETSFSFETLSQGIQQFTTAGIDIATATSAAMGVTGLAGSSKVFDASKIQSAMNAVAKAMQNGYMDTMKWNTLTQTSGVVTKEFSQSLLDAAAAEGKLIKSAAGQYKTKEGKLVTTSNIGSTLSSKWMTKNVLNKALSDYSVVSEKINDIYNQIQNGELSDGALSIIGQVNDKEIDKYNVTAKDIYDSLDALGYSFTETQKKAFLSSQETSTFGQAVSAVADAAKTQWQNLWQYVFGDADAAAELWGEVYDALSALNVPLGKVVSAFEEWNDLEEGMGGSSDFREGLKNLAQIVVKIFDSINEGFEAVFGQLNSSALSSATKSFKDATEGILKNEGLYDKVKTFFTWFFRAIQVVGKALKVVGKIISGIWSVVSNIFMEISPYLEALWEWVQAVCAGVADLFTEISNDVDVAKIFDSVLEGITTAFKWFIGILQSAWTSISEWFAEFKKTDIYAWLKDKIDWIKKLFTDAGDFFSNLWVKIKETWEKIYSKLDEWGVIDFFKKVGETFKEYWINTIKPKYFTDLSTSLKNLLSLAGKIMMFVTIIRLLNFLKLGSYLTDLTWELEKLAKSATARNYVIVIASIAASILAVVLAAGMLKDTDTASITSITVLLGTLILMFTAMTITISKLTGQKLEKGQKYKQFNSYIRMTLAIVILINAVVSAAKKISDVPSKYLWEMVAVLVICSIAISAVAKFGTQLKKQSKNIKFSQKVVSRIFTATISLINLCLFIALAAKMFVSVSVGQLLKVGGILIAATAAIGVVSWAMVKFSKDTPSASVLSLGVSKMILFVAVFDILATMIESVALNMEQMGFLNQLKAIGVLLLLAAGAILIVCGALIAMNFVIKRIDATALTPAITIEIKTLATLAALAIISVLAIKITEALYEKFKALEINILEFIKILGILTGVIVVTALYMIGFNIVLRKFFKESVKVQSTLLAALSPILIAFSLIGLVILILVLAKNYGEQIKALLKQYWGWLVAVAAILVTVTAAMTAVGIALKDANKSLSAITVALIVILATFLFLYFMFSIYGIDVSAIIATLSIYVIVLGVLALFIFGIVEIMNVWKANQVATTKVKSLKTILIMFGVVMGIVSATLAVLSFRDPRNILYAVLAMVLVIIFVTAAMIAILYSIKKVDVGDNKIAKIIAIFATFSIVIAVVGGLVAYLSTINQDLAVGSAVIIGALMVLLVVILRLLVHVCKTADNLKIGSISKIVVLFVVMAAVIAAVVACMLVMSQIEQMGGSIITYAIIVGAFILAIVVAMWALSALASTPPAWAAVVLLLALAVAIGAFAAVLFGMGYLVEKLKEFFQTLIDGVDAIPRLADNLVYLGNTIGDNGVWENLKLLTRLGEINKNIKKTDGYEKMAKALDKFIPVFDAFAESDTAALFNFIELLSLGGITKSDAKTTAKAFEIIQDALNDLGTFHLSMQIDVEAINLEPLKEQIKEAILSAWESIKGVGTTAVNSATDAASTAYDWGSAKVSDIWSSSQRGFGKVGNWFSNAWSSAKETGASIINNITNNFNVNEDTPYEVEKAYADTIVRSSRLNVEN